MKGFTPGTGAHLCFQSPVDWGPDKKRPKGAAQRSWGRKWSAETKLVQREGFCLAHTDRGSSLDPPE